MVKRSLTKGLQTCAIILLPFLVYLIPKASLFEGESICLFKRLLGVECPGCGMTRAIVSMMYLDFEAAWGYNHLSVVVAPLLLYLWVKSLVARQ